MLLDLIEASPAQRIPFDVFMDYCLYHPSLGYYQNNRVKIGSDGDFSTAPQLSPIFSQLIAHHCLDAFDALSNTVPIIEFGAGLGHMAQHILQTLTEHNKRPTSYIIVEKSKTLIKRQKKRLSEALSDELFECLVWTDELPQTESAVVLANELFDAFIVKRYRREASGWSEQFICRGSNEGLAYSYMPVNLSCEDLGIAKVLADELPQGYIIEKRQGVTSFFAQLGFAINHCIFLTLDYGGPSDHMYQSMRVNGTLTTHFAQMVSEDPLKHPGIQDMTTHVDFTELAHDCGLAGFEVAGYCPQAHFLMSLGLVDLASAHREPHLISGQINTLTSPSEMGELIKAFIATKNVSYPDPLGMSFRNFDDLLF